MSQAYKKTVLISKKMIYNWTDCFFPFEFFISIYVTKIIFIYLKSESAPR
jgi:hypothetical protein